MLLSLPSTTRGIIGSIRPVGSPFLKNLLRICNCFTILCNWKYFQLKMKSDYREEKEGTVKVEVEIFEGKEENKKEEEKEAKNNEEEETKRDKAEEENSRGRRDNGCGEMTTRERECPTKGVRFIERAAGGEGTDEMERLEEYERKLRRNTKEALELVDRLCELQQGQTAPAERIPPRLPSTKNHSDTNVGELRKALAEGVSQMGGRGAIGEQRADRTDIGEGGDFDVESVSLSGRLLHSPVDCVLLPGHSLLLVDSSLGLSLLSLQSRQMIRNICPPENGQWRNAQCACLGESKGLGQSVVYVLLEHRRTKGRAEGAKANGTRLIPGDEFTPKCNGSETKSAIQADQTQQNGTEVEETEFAQFIYRFSLPEMEMIDRIEAPKWLRERVVTQCRLCFVPQTECLYLAANTPNQGFLYELNIGQGKWTECAGTKRFRNYSDLHPFAVIGPVTELLLVETNRCYVQMVSLYGSNIVHERMFGLCERPGALCVDERGNLFVFDRANSKVGLFSRTYLEKMGDVALVERANCRLSAREGVLAVLCGMSRELKLHRYSEEHCLKE